MSLIPVPGGRQYPVCDACTERSEAAGVRRARRDRYRRDRLLTIIPPSFRHARLGAVPAALRAALQQRGHRESVYLWGCVGCGKSFTVAAVLRDLIIKCTNRNMHVERTTHARLDRALRDTFTAGSKASENDILRPFLSAHLTVLEDVGAGVSPSAFTQRILELIIDERMEQCLPTIITSNWSVEQIEAQYGPRIGSRLCTYMIVELQGRDRRKTANDHQTVNEKQEPATNGGCD